MNFLIRLKFQSDPRFQKRYTMKPFANMHGHSDVHPYEVVRVINPKMIEVRKMAAHRDPAFKPEFVPGGFSAHCTNQDKQTWIITQDKTNPLVKVRLRKNGQWWSRYGRHVLADEPRKFYDFNF